MNKKGMLKIKILGIFLILILSIGTLSFTISSQLKEEDIKYEKGINGKEDLKVSFGIEGNVELKSHQTVKEIIIVQVGNSVASYYDFNFNTPQLNGIGDAKFINQKTKKEVIKNYSFVYWGNQTRLHSKVLENGTKDEYNYTFIGWLPYKTRDIPIGNIRIGLLVTVEPDETIDAIWKILNYELKKHAIYTSGAAITTNTTFTQVYYTSNGTFNVTDNILFAQILIVGAGGAGGSQGGGGGGGGVIYKTNQTFPIGNYNIIIGQGGTGNADRTVAGENGSNTSIHFLNGTLFANLRTAGGGGGGARLATGPQAGSSGGGGDGTPNNGALSVYSQGNSGGNGNDAGFESSGGGGGNSTAGSNAASNVGGAGGLGYNHTLLNETLFQYGCGGGGSVSTESSGTGGKGCGGWGGVNNQGGDGSPRTGAGGGGAGYTYVAGSGTNGVIIIRYLSSVNITNTMAINLTTANNSIFLNRPIGLSTEISKSSGISILNVSLLINNSINQTNTSGSIGLYNFSLNTGDGIYFWDIEAYDNNSVRYTSSNGTFRFNMSTPPQAPPNLTTNIPNFTMAYNSNLNIDFTNYFSMITNNISGYVNISFIDYDLTLLQSIIPTYLSNSSNNTKYFLGNDFQIIMDGKDFDINSYTTNRTIKINATACNVGGCTSSNTFYINITEPEKGISNFITKTSNWFLTIFPDSQDLSFFQKLGIMFIVMLLLSVMILMGLNFSGVEAPNNVYITGIFNIFLIFYFILIGYISIWIIIGLIILSVAISFMRGRSE